MVVEDDRLIALDLQNTINSLGYEAVGPAASGEQAVMMAKRLSPDIVLMDVVLQGEMDGIVAAAAIKDGLGVPVVYITAHTDQSTLSRARLTEPQGFIVKPVNPAQLKAGLEMALYRRAAGDHDASGSPPVGGDRGGVFEVLAKLELFLDIAEQRLRTLALSGRFQKVAAREVITFEGDAAARPFVVVSGRVAMVKMSPDGRELIVELLTPNDAFGLIPALEAESAWLTAKAQLDSEILVLSRSALMLLVEEDRGLQRRLAQYAAWRLRLSHEFARALAHDRVEPRLASILLTLTERCAEPGRGRSPPRISMTRQELASLAGNSLETTIRVTKAMEREGILALRDRGQIEVVDINGLRELAEGGR